MTSAASFRHLLNVLLSCLLALSVPQALESLTSRIDVGGQSDSATTEDFDEEERAEAVPGAVLTQCRRTRRPADCMRALTERSLFRRSLGDVEKPKSPQCPSRCGVLGGIPLRC